MTIITDEQFVRMAQGMLKNRGYYDGPIDGIVGDKTINGLTLALNTTAEIPRPVVLLDERSEKNLAGVHPDLVKVIRRAYEISPIRFTVIEGLRSIDRQRHLVSIGASQTMNSRHLTGHAADLALLKDDKISWDWPLYYQFAPFVKAAAEELRIPIEWGGNWTTLKDGPHWQLPWGEYPA